MLRSKALTINFGFVLFVFALKMDIAQKFPTKLHFYIAYSACFETACTAVLQQGKSEVGSMYFFASLSIQVHTYLCLILHILPSIFAQKVDFRGTGLVYGKHRSTTKSMCWGFTRLLCTPLTDCIYSTNNNLLLLQLSATCLSFTILLLNPRCELLFPATSKLPSHKQHWEKGPATSQRDRGLLALTHAHTRTRSLPSPSGGKAVS